MDWVINVYILTLVYLDGFIQSEQMWENNQNNKRGQIHNISHIQTPCQRSWIVHNTVSFCLVVFQNKFGKNGQLWLWKYKNRLDGYSVYFSSISCCVLACCVRGSSSFPSSTEHCPVELHDAFTASCAVKLLQYPRVLHHILCFQLFSCAHTHTHTYTHAHTLKCLLINKRAKEKPDGETFAGD